MIKLKPFDLYFDARALKCPLLFVQTKQRLKKLLPNQLLLIRVTDKAGINDIKNYLDKQGFKYTMNASAVDIEFYITIKEG